MDNLSLTERLLDGDRRALAKAITVMERGGADAGEILARLYSHTGAAHRIGVTGAPGVGKSTLVNALAKAARQRDLTVAVVAVDPTSPFTGGAVLGDRVRMQDLTGDPGIFIRSMATRGSLGGVARATSDVAEVLDAAGFDLVIIETVGAGQSEIDVARLAHTTVVIEAPGLGDEIQAIKAGILEIADLLVVNKADHPNADLTLRALQVMLELGALHPASFGYHGPLDHSISGNGSHGSVMSTAETWKVPVLKTVAAQGQGIEAVLDAIQEHRANLMTGQGLAVRERARVATALETHLHEALLTRLAESLGFEEIDRAIEAVMDHKTDPKSAASQLIDHVWPLPD